MINDPDPLGKTLKNEDVFYPVDYICNEKYKPTSFFIKSCYVRVFRFKYAKPEVFPNFFVNSSHWISCVACITTYDVVSTSIRRLYDVGDVV